MKRSDILDNSIGKGLSGEINEMNRYIDYLEKSTKDLKLEVLENLEGIEDLTYENERMTNFLRFLGYTQEDIVNRVISGKDHHWHLVKQKDKN
jgi:hypothetical protein